MAEKQHPAGSPVGEPAEVFRQFAWHLAGSIASNRAASRAASPPPPVKPRRAKGATKR
jgi:hypothetical protein